MAGAFNPSIFNPAIFNTGSTVGPIFNRGIFNVGIFNTGDEGEAAPEVVVKTGTGGIDPAKRRYPPVKPTGILHLPKRGKLPETVEKRIVEAFNDRAEIAENLAREFGEETAQIPEFKPIVQMTMAEVEAEIGVLLRKELRTREEEALLIILMASVV